MADAAKLLLLVEHSDAEGLRAALAASGAPEQHSNTTFTEERVSLLHVACARGADAAARVLLDAGAAPRARDAGGVTPLHRAACEGHQNCVSLLLERGAKVRAPATRWDSRRDAAGPASAARRAKAPHRTAQSLIPPVHTACRLHGSLVPIPGGLTRRPLATQPGDRDATGAVPLHDAAFHGHAGAAAALLSAGADPAAFSQDGSTVLHYAAVAGAVAVVRLLLGAGVVADARATELATQHGHWEVAACLLGASQESAAKDAAAARADAKAARDEAAAAMAVAAAAEEAIAAGAAAAAAAPPAPPPPPAAAAPARAALTAAELESIAAAVRAANEAGVSRWLEAAAKRASMEGGASLDHRSSPGERPGSPAGGGEAGGAAPAWGADELRGKLLELQTQRDGLEARLAAAAQENRTLRTQLVEESDVVAEHRQALARAEAAEAAAAAAAATLASAAGIDVRDLPSAAAAVAHALRTAAQRAEAANAAAAEAVAAAAEASAELAAVRTSAAKMAANDGAAADAAHNQLATVLAERREAEDVFMTRISELLSERETLRAQIAHLRTGAPMPAMPPAAPMHAAPMVPAAPVSSVPAYQPAADPYSRPMPMAAPPAAMMPVQPPPPPPQHIPPRPASPAVLTEGGDGTLNPRARPVGLRPGVMPSITAHFGLNASGGAAVGAPSPAAGARPRGRSPAPPSLGGNGLMSGASTPSAPPATPVDSPANTPLPTPNGTPANTPVVSRAPSPMPPLSPPPGLAAVAAAREEDDRADEVPPPPAAATPRPRARLAPPPSAAAAAVTMVESLAPPPPPPPPAAPQQQQQQASDGDAEAAARLSAKLAVWQEAKARLDGVRERSRSRDRSPSLAEARARSSTPEPVEEE